MDDWRKTCREQRSRARRCLFALLPLLALNCATTAPVDESAAALAAAKSWQTALVAGDFDGAMGLVDEHFSSSAWRTREDLRFYLQQAQDRRYFEPASAIAAPASVTATTGQFIVYPVGIRAAAGVAVFGLTFAPRESGIKIISATLEFY